MSAAAEDAAEDVDLTLIADGIESLAVCVDEIKDSRDVLVEGRGLFDSAPQQPEGSVALGRIGPPSGYRIARVMAPGRLTEFAR